jgi:glycosyltransferase involved in cell wall biosynthesis
LNAFERGSNTSVKLPEMRTMNEGRASSKRGQDARYRITFVSFTGLTKGAGSEHFILNLVKKLPDDFEASIIQTDLVGNPHLPASYVEGVLRAHNTRLFTARRDPLPGWQTGFLFVLKNTLGPFLQRILNHSLLTEIRSDIFYLTRNDDVLWLPGHALIIGSTIAQFLSTRGRLGRLFLLLKYRHIRAFHFTSWKLFQASGIRKKRDFVLPLGVETSMFYPSSQNHGSTVRFLFVGRLEPSKGVDLLLHAWKIVREKKQNVELHIAGSGNLANLVREDNTVTYHETAHQGGQGEDDLGALYRDCDIFVFPSAGETFGLVVIEALASGLYVITSPALKGIFDVFAEKYKMLEYVERTTAELADAMLRAYSTISSIRSRKQTVSEYARENYSWEIIGERFYSTVRHLYASRES